MNYYEILKVSKEANQDEIKTAYKNLVKKYHPDLYIADKEFAEKKIKEINEAYNILSNPELKQEYDDYLYEMEHPEIKNQNIEDSNVDNKPTGDSAKSKTWFFEKFERLSKRNQIKIFLIGLFILFIIFLSNLIKIKNTLEDSKRMTENTETNQEYTSPTDVQNIIQKPYYFTDNYYDEELQDQFNQFYNSLMGEYMNMFSEE